MPPLADDRRFPRATRNRLPRKAARPSPAFLLLAAFLTLMLLTGGASRPDTYQLFIVRSGTVMFATALLILPGVIEVRRFAGLWIALGLYAGLMLIQLVPLPPGLWWALPGHAALRPLADAAKVSDIWRPISLVPDLTLNSAVALLPPATVLIGMGRIDPAEWARLVPMVAIGAMLSALFGLLQLLGGPDSPFYLYHFTTRSLPVGLFANRNHAAVFLAISLPLFAWWAGARASGSQRDGDLVSIRLLIAGTMGIATLLSILLTGSRSGTVLGGLAVTASASILLSNMSIEQRQQWRPWIIAAMIVVLASLAAIALASGRAASLARFTEGDGLTTEKRIRALPVLLRMLSDFAPFGIGFGAFEPVFRWYEPADLLMPTYFNRAHNDLLELAISGGVPAVLLMLGFLVWLIRTAIRGWRRYGVQGVAVPGACTIGLLFAASLSDYPLRTPVLAVLFTIACTWLCPAEDIRRTPRSGSNTVRLS